MVEASRSWKRWNKKSSNTLLALLNRTTEEDVNRRIRNDDDEANSADASHESKPIDTARAAIGDSHE